MILITHTALLACLAGLLTSVYIFQKKRTKTKLVCPLRANCDKVVHSTFSTTFGIANEILGVGYYIVISTLYGFMLAYPLMFDTAMIHYLLTILSIGGALFSIYLIALQMVVIRAWCSWCLVSAFANIVLVLCLFGFPNEGLFDILSTNRVFWIIIHNIGFILGLGAATITDVLFFRFLKDHSISEEEKGILETLSNVIWIGLSILIVSGLMLFLPEQARLMASSKFLLKVVVVSVILLNGITLNLYVSPRMRQLSFDGTRPAMYFRRIAFALGGISITSWYAAFVLGSLRNIPISLSLGLCIYGVVLLGVIVVSQIFERIAVRKMGSSPLLKER